MLFLLFERSPALGGEKKARGSPASGRGRRWWRRWRGWGGGQGAPKLGEMKKKKGNLLTALLEGSRKKRTLKGLFHENITF